METFLIAGLGNPGAEYTRTRHNAGFLVVELLAERGRAAWTVEKKFASRVARGEWSGRRGVLCQPQTFMNASGEAVGALLKFYRVEPKNALVVVDDADLPFGEIRMRERGGPGGHHGLESVEQHLGTSEYPRLRIGIGRTRSGVREITGHVLGAFNADEQKVLPKILDRAADQVETWLAHGIQQAMNQFNGAVDGPAKQPKDTQ
jgi:PTH1 family peptidyl-tRNA hydrolase